MNNKKVIVCDLDGTLAASKSALTNDMAEVILHILGRHYMAVVSGGSYEQFQKQFLSQLHDDPDLLKNLSLFPTNGSTCYVYDSRTSRWKQLYEERLKDSERREIISALEKAVKESKLDLSSSFGPIIEDRGTQVTFSGRGQNAPLSVKEVWDSDQNKRRMIVELLRKKIPQFEIRIGGSTSIDITRKGVDKAYAIGKIKKLLNVTDDDIIFVGDALYKGGNDAAIKSTGVDFIQESGPNQTIELLSRYM